MMFYPIAGCLGAHVIIQEESMTSRKIHRRPLEMSALIGAGALLVNAFTSESWWEGIFLIATANAFFYGIRLLKKTAIPDIFIVDQRWSLVFRGRKKIAYVEDNPYKTVQHELLTISLFVLLGAILFSSFASLVFAHGLNHPFGNMPNLVKIALNMASGWALGWHVARAVFTQPKAKTQSKRAP
jgi:hypothetical protein